MRRQITLLMILLVILLQVCYASEGPAAVAVAAPGGVTQTSEDSYTAEQFTNLENPTAAQFERITPSTAKQNKDVLNAMSASERSKALTTMVGDRSVTISQSLLESVDNDMSATQIAEVMQSMAGSSADKTTARNYLSNNLNKDNINFEVIDSYYSGAYPTGTVAKWNAEETSLAQTILTSGKYTKDQGNYNGFAEDYCSAVTREDANAGACDFDPTADLEFTLSRGTDGDIGSFELSVPNGETIILDMDQGSLNSGTITATDTGYILQGIQGEVTLYNGARNAANAYTIDVAEGSSAGTIQVGSPTGTGNVKGISEEGFQITVLDGKNVEVDTPTSSLPIVIAGDSIKGVDVTTSDTATLTFDNDNNLFQVKGELISYEHPFQEGQRHQTGYAKTDSGAWTSADGTATIIRDDYVGDYLKTNTQYASFMAAYDDKNFIVGTSGAWYGESAAGGLSTSYTADTYMKNYADDGTLTARSAEHLQSAGEVKDTNSVTRSSADGVWRTDIYSLEGMNSKVTDAVDALTSDTGDTSREGFWRFGSVDADAAAQTLRDYGLLLDPPETSNTFNTEIDGVVINSETQASLFIAGTVANRGLGNDILIGNVGDTSGNYFVAETTNGKDVTRSMILGDMQGVTTDTPLLTTSYYYNVGDNTYSTTVSQGVTDGKPIISSSKGQAVTGDNYGTIATSLNFETAYNSISDLEDTGQGGQLGTTDSFNTRELAIQNTDTSTARAWIFNRVDDEGETSSSIDHIQFSDGTKSINLKSSQLTLDDEGLSEVLGFFQDGQGDYYDAAENFGAKRPAATVEAAKEQADALEDADAALAAAAADKDGDGIVSDEEAALVEETPGAAAPKIPADNTPASLAAAAEEVTEETLEGVQTTRTALDAQVAGLEAEIASLELSDPDNTALSAKRTELASLQASQAVSDAEITYLGAQQDYAADKSSGNWNALLTARNDYETAQGSQDYDTLENQISSTKTEIERLTRTKQSTSTPGHATANAGIDAQIAALGAQLNSLESEQEATTNPAQAKASADLNLYASQVNFAREQQTAEPSDANTEATTDAIDALLNFRTTTEINNAGIAANDAESEFEDAKKDTPAAQATAEQALLLETMSIYDRANNAVSGLTAKGDAAKESVGNTQLTLVAGAYGTESISEALSGLHGSTDGVTSNVDLTRATAGLETIVKSGDLTTTVEVKGQQMGVTELMAEVEQATDSSNTEMASKVTALSDAVEQTQEARRLTSTLAQSAAAAEPAVSTVTQFGTRTVSLGATVTTPAAGGNPATTVPAEYTPFGYGDTTYYARNNGGTLEVVKLSAGSSGTTVSTVDTDAVFGTSKSNVEDLVGIVPPVAVAVPIASP